MNEFQTMDTLVKQFFGQAPFKPSPVAYCDYIAEMIKMGLPGDTGGEVSTGRVRSDLHPHEGYLLSTKKTIEAEYLGKKYKITIEEA